MMKNGHRGGIYEIVSPSGNRYIGSTLVFSTRWNGHKYELRKGAHHSVPLQKAWDKYGPKRIVFRIVEIIDNPTVEELIEREQWYFDHHDPQYNVAKVAGSRRGVRVTPERKARQSRLIKELWADPDGRARMLAARTDIDQIDKARRQRATRESRKAEGQSYSPSPSNIAATIARNRLMKGRSRKLIFNENRPLVATNTSGEMCVHWEKRSKRWSVHILIHCKMIARRFDDKEQAIEFRDRAMQLGRAILNGLLVAEQLDREFPRDPEKVRSKSGMRGVYRDRYGKWKASALGNYLGMFATAEEASRHVQLALAEADKQKPSRYTRR